MFKNDENKWFEFIEHELKNNGSKRYLTSEFYKILKDYKKFKNKNKIYDLLKLGFKNGVFENKKNCPYFKSGYWLFLQLKHDQYNVKFIEPYLSSEFLEIYKALKTNITLELSENVFNLLCDLVNDIHTEKDDSFLIKMIYKEDLTKLLVSQLAIDSVRKSYTEQFSTDIKRVKDKKDFGLFELLAVLRRVNVILSISGNNTHHVLIDILLEVIDKEITKKDTACSLIKIFIHKPEILERSKNPLIKELFVNYKKVVEILEKYYKKEETEIIRYNNILDDILLNYLFKQNFDLKEVEESIKVLKEYS